MAQIDLVDASQTKPWQWDNVDRVVAVGDVHGAFDEFVAILQECKLVSPEGVWIGGKTHLVLLGDLVDRGPRGRQVLDLVMRLQVEARESGGWIHVLLGNHEVMNLTGDLRYVSDEDFASYSAEESRKERTAAFRRMLRDKKPGTRATSRLQAEFGLQHPDGYFALRRAFLPDGVYGRWLLKQQILVVVNGVVFVHGGLSPALLDTAAEDVNRVAMTELRDYLGAKARLEKGGVLKPEMTAREQLDRARKLVLQHEVEGRVRGVTDREIDLLRIIVDSSEGLVFRSDGPLWYRGSALNPSVREKPIAEKVLNHLGAERAVVGHTPNHTGRISARLGGALLMADTGMLVSHYGGRASALIWQDDGIHTQYAGEGSRPFLSVQLEPAIGAFTGDVEVEEFLRAAPMVSIEEVGTGSTRPSRVTLEMGGKRCRAIYKSLEKQGPCFPGEEGNSCRDSFAHEVAAYRIDRALGFNLVPPAIIREIKGKTGSVQLWVEGAINEQNRTNEDLQPEKPEFFLEQVQRTSLFDFLLVNPNRNGTNMLITPTDWKVHLIDHSRALNPMPSLAEHLNAMAAYVDTELAESLVSADLSTLEHELDPLLTDEQVESLFDRIRGLQNAVKRKHEKSSP
jgi:hypothetical protein